MYDDIIHLAMDQQLITEIRERDVVNYQRLPLWKQLQKNEDTSELEGRLRKNGQLTFDQIFFREPVGYHLIKSFLINEHSVDKAVFLSDVEVFKKLQDASARLQVSKKIFDRFCAAEDSVGGKKYRYSRKNGLSVFEKVPSELQKAEESEDDDRKRDEMNGSLNDPDSSGGARIKYRLSLMTESTNSIGVYGRPISRLKKKLNSLAIIPVTIFDEVCEDVINDLRLDVFPRFVRSRWFTMYLRCYKYIDETITTRRVGIKEFQQMRMLGRGAFGVVNACKKKDTGKLYAVKQISKKRVQATDSTEAIMSERNFLAKIGVGSSDCRYCTTLKYAFDDSETLFIVLDLMIGGDLKYHLNHERQFNEERSRFYAAQVVLGLEHIHAKDIVYRDLKLENVLMDDKGNIRLSDLGLAVTTKDSKGNKKYVRGYAGTPGYTAPEVVLGHYYDHIVDFFSLGVMLYRFLCGKKPFQSQRRRRDRGHKGRQNQTAELDRNVVEMEPSFSPDYFSASARSLIKGLICKNPERRLGFKGIAQIKEHPWFDPLDFGLLEAGYLEPPFTPSLDEIHAEQAQHIGRPPQDEQFQKIRLTKEFDDSLRGFPYTSKVIVQEELVEVLIKVNAQSAEASGKGKPGTLGGPGKGAGNPAENPFDFPDGLAQDRSGTSCMACTVS